MPRYLISCSVLCGYLSDCFSFRVSPLVDVSFRLQHTVAPVNGWLLARILLSLTSFQLYLHYWYREVKIATSYIFASRFTLVVEIWKFRPNVCFFLSGRNSGTRIYGTSFLPHPFNFCIQDWDPLSFQHRLQRLLISSGLLDFVRSK